MTPDPLLMALSAALIGAALGALLVLAFAPRGRR